MPPTTSAHLSCLLHKRRVWLPSVVLLVQAFPPKRLRLQAPDIWVLLPRQSAKRGEAGWLRCTLSRVYFLEHRGLLRSSVSKTTRLSTSQKRPQLVSRVVRSIFIRHLASRNVFILAWSYLSHPKKNRRPLEHEAEFLWTQVRMEGELLAHLDATVEIRDKEVASVKQELAVLQNRLEAARAVRDSASHAMSALGVLSQTMIKESSVESSLSTHTTDLVTRVRFEGQETEWAETAARIQESTPTHETIGKLAQKRVDHITIELDAAQSMYQFAQNALNAIQASRQAVSESMRSKIAFLLNINILPPEILLKIFQHVVVHEIRFIQGLVRDPDVPYSHKTGPIRSPLVLQAVCQQWRHLAQSCSELWQGLALSGGDYVGHSGLSSSEQKQLDRMNYYLERNQAAPLQLIIHIRLTRFTSAFFNAAFSRLKGRTIKQLLISAKHLDNNLNPITLPNQLQTYLPTFENFVSDAPTAQVIEMVPWNTGNGRPTLTFRPRVGWFYACRSFICHGVVPLLEPPGAERVTHLSITRTSKNNWEFYGILRSFPNLTHLEVDPTRTGCRQSLQDLPTNASYTTSSLQHITTSMEGLDDLTKYLQHGLSLPSLTHLTLVDTASRSDPEMDPWPEFTASSLVEQITTFEVLRCSKGDFPSLRSLRSLHAIKLHHTAAMKGSQCLTPIVDDSSPTVVIPPGLKEVHYFDSDIDGEAILNMLSGIRKQEEYNGWTCGVQFSGCPNIKLKTLAAFRELYGEPFTAQCLSVN